MLKINVSIPLRGSSLAKLKESVLNGRREIKCFNPLAGKSFGKVESVIDSAPKEVEIVSIPLRGSRLAKFQMEVVCYEVKRFNPLAGKSFGKE